MVDALPTFERNRFMGLIAVLSFGLTSLFAVLNLGVLVPATFVTGFLILLPLVAVLGSDCPLVEPEDAAEARTSADAAETTGRDPVATLKHRYAAGEIDEAEFERRLDRLLETDETAGRTENGGTRRETADLETELE